MKMNAKDEAHVTAQLYHWKCFHTNDFEDDFFLSKLIYKDQRQLSSIQITLQHHAWKQVDTS